MNNQQSKLIYDTPKLRPLLYIAVWVGLAALLSLLTELTLPLGFLVVALFLGVCSLILLFFIGVKYIRWKYFNGPGEIEL